MKELKILSTNMLIVKNFIKKNVQNIEHVYLENFGDYDFFNTFGDIPKKILEMVSRDRTSCPESRNTFHYLWTILLLQNKLF